MRLTIILLFLAAFSASASKPGSGKHVVLVAGDDEYHSEQMMPQFAKILEQRQGFRCTVLYSRAADGSIDPHARQNIPGLEALKTADLLILFTRFRDLPDEQMKHIVDYVESGKPIVAIRTATHAFEIPAGKTYSGYSWNREGGFGRRVLGETWVAHHADHGKQSTRGRIAAGQASHPILRGIGDGEIWGPTDVYEVHLPERCLPLVMGEVLSGMQENDSPVEGRLNHPMMPIAWTTEYKGGRVFVSTIGAADDFLNEGVRRLLVNATIWAAGREERIPRRSDVRLIGDYIPKSFIE